MAELSNLQGTDLYRELATDLLGQFLASHHSYIIYTVKSKPFNKSVLPRTWNAVTMNNVAGQLNQILSTSIIGQDVTFLPLKVKPLPDKVDIIKVPYDRAGEPYLVSRFILSKSPEMILTGYSVAA